MIIKICIALFLTAVAIALGWAIKRLIKEVGEENKKKNNE